MKDLRSLPSIDQLLRTPAGEAQIQRFGHTLALEILREYLEDIRSDQIKGVPAADQILNAIEARLAEAVKPSLARVINATGVILHTNLGRAPLSNASIAAMEAAAKNYSTLEYDLKSGTRGSRHVHCEQMLTRLSGAEAALVVNNNAGAVLLILSALFHNKKVAISRSQLVEIGGSFRIPDVMRQSGARLMEVGTTNQTHNHDYMDALADGAVGLVRVHSSNFKIIGFSNEPDLVSMVDIAHQAGALIVDDLGSGSFLDTKDYGLNHEPMVQESIKAGVDVVSFSGDKLLGGPQAGIIVGRKVLLDKIKKHPLARAIRADKLCLAGLSATLSHYLIGKASQEIPVWKMISHPVEVLRERALCWQDQLGFGAVIPGASTVGGGSLPGETLPTWLLALKVKSPEKMLNYLRMSEPIIIARILDDHVVIDPRTVFEDDEGVLIDLLKHYYPEHRKTL